MPREFPTDNVAADSTAAADAASTLANLVYERLRNDIFGGQLSPGTRLRVDFVCERYGMGSSPVREALTRLAAEGIIKREDKRGFFVAGVSADEFRQLTDTRCWIEELALRRSIEHGDDVWEEGIVVAFHRLSRIRRPPAGTAFLPPSEWGRRHDAFHNALIANCGSHWLIDFCKHLRDQAYRYRRYVSEERTSASLEEHEAIMRATLDRDTEKATALLIAHYRTTEEITLRRYQSGDDYSRGD